MKQYNNQENHAHSSAWAFWRRSLATIRLPQRSLSSQTLGKLLITQPEQPKDRTNNTLKWALTDNNTIKHGKIYDRES